MTKTKNAYWRWGFITIILTLLFWVCGFFLLRFIVRTDLMKFLDTGIKNSLLFLVLFSSGQAAFTIVVRHFVKKRLIFNDLWSFGFAIGSYASIITGIIFIIADDLPDQDNLFYDLVIGVMCLIAWAVMYTVFAAIYIQIANLILRKRFKTMNKISIEVLDDDLPKPQRKLRRPPPSRRR